MVNENEGEVETGDSDPENVEEVLEYDSSTDEDVNVNVDLLVSS